MLHAGLDLSRKRLDVHVVDDEMVTVEVTGVLPDRGGLQALVQRLASHGQPVRAAIESMTGARFIHDELERLGWEVEIADAQRVKGVAPLACKTDRIDARVLAELSCRSLVPAVWLPAPDARAARERARWRQHLVRHRKALKCRVHAVLMTFGHQCPVSDLFGVKGRKLLDDLRLPEPWATSVTASLRLIDRFTEEIDGCERELRRHGADDPDLHLLMTVPGISWILASIILGEIGDITRFASPAKLTGYTGLCPRVYQSGAKDRRGSLAKNGPKYLRWALIEAATNACKHPLYRDHYQATKKRLGKQRGKKVARVQLARKLAEAIWYILTRHQAFAPAGPSLPMVA
ncbi:MAG: IS110 family transposase [Chloroflexi bacterium]|nr:IS110 family transposase [Chloroflexota bacterium]